MSYLLDTSVLVRLANKSDARHLVALSAVIRLHRQNAVLHVFPQVMIEFRSVATRPAAVNGLGLTVADAESHAATFEKIFDLLAETQAVYPAWKQLVSSLNVSGKQVHDARLVAACHVNSVAHLLTFNTSHFERLARCSPPIDVVNPSDVH